MEFGNQQLLVALCIVLGFATNIFCQGVRTRIAMHLKVKLVQEVAVIQVAQASNKLRAASSSSSS